MASGPAEKRTLSWLHLSDIHYKADEQYRYDSVLDPLLEKITKESEKIKPDLIFVTGDIAYSGKTENYEKVTPFFDKLLKATNVPKKHLYIIPGNHDIDLGIVASLHRKLPDHADAIDFFKQGAKLYDLEKFKAYFDWYENFMETPCPLNETTCRTLPYVEINDLNVGLLSVNTALFSFYNEKDKNDKDTGKLMIGEPRLAEALKELQSQSPSPDVVIALLHHPLEDLDHREISSVRNNLRKHCDVLLLGHLHDADAETRSGPSSAERSPDLFQAVTGATYDADLNYKFFRCYFGRLNANQNPCRIYLRPLVYFADRKVWEIDNIYEDDNHDRWGEFKIHLKSAQKSTCIAPAPSVPRSVKPAPAPTTIVPVVVRRPQRPQEAEPAEMVEGVIVLLARLDPPRQTGLINKLAAEIAEIFKKMQAGAHVEPQKVLLKCLGRYDAMCIIRADPSDWEKVSNLPTIDGLKKLDVQYGYVRESDAKAFWDQVEAGHFGPMVTMSYVRVRDDLRIGFHERVVNGRLIAALEQKGGLCRLLIRGIGWPDYIVVASSDDITQLIDLVQNSLWGAQIGSEGLEYYQSSEAKPRNADWQEGPLFSRVYTVLGYKDRPALANVKGAIPYPVLIPQVRLRLRPGARKALMEAVQHAFKAATEDPEKKLPLKRTVCLLLGTEDAMIDLQMDAGTTKIQANALLDWFVEYFMKEPKSTGELADATIADVATGVELRIGIDGDHYESVVPALIVSPNSQAILTPPQELINSAENRYAMLAGPVVASARSLSRTINWAVANDGIQRDFMDLYRHTKAYFQFVNREIASGRWEPERLESSLTIDQEASGNNMVKQPSSEGSESGGTNGQGMLTPTIDPKMLDDLGNSISVTSQAFAQRLAGSYYDLTSYTPEIVLEYCGGIQKFLACLYAIQNMCLNTACNHFGVKQPSAYWVISTSGKPAEVLIQGGTVAFCLGSSLAFNLSRAGHAIVHELMHFVWRAYLYSLTPSDSAVIEPSTTTVWLQNVLAIMTPWWEKLAPKYSHPKKNVKDESWRLWWTDTLTIFDKFFNEAMADALSFPLVLNGNLREYKRETILLFTRTPQPVEVVFKSWVIEALSAALVGLGWSDDKATKGEPLSDLLRAKHDEGLYMSYYLQENIERPPDFTDAFEGMDQRTKKRLQELVLNGWNDLCAFNLNSSHMQVSLDTLIEQARRIVEELDTQTTDLRKGLECLKDLGRFGTHMNPAVIEELADLAIADLYRRDAAATLA